MWLATLCIAYVAWECWGWASHARAVLSGPKRECELSESQMALCPPVSFLVPAWNAAQDIPSFIESFQRLMLPQKELVLCVGGADNSLAVALEYADVDTIVIPQMEGEGKQRALQKAFQESHGHILYLTDIDCHLQDGTVWALLNAIVNGEESVVTGGIAPSADQWAVPFVRATAAKDVVAALNQSGVVTGLRGCNAALSRAALIDGGEFKTDAPSGTDYTLAQELRRAGHRILFVPGEPMRTRYTESVPRSIRQRRRWIRNIFILGRRYGVNNDVMGALKTFALAYGMIGLLLMGLLWRPAWILVAMLIVHVLSNQIRLQRDAGFQITLSGALYTFLSDQVAALLATTDVVTGRTPW